MKPTTLFFVAALIFNGSGSVLARQSVGRGPISAPRDPELEKQSQHNLKVARYYFYQRKPPKNDPNALERLNKAVESRLLEILDLNPNFAKIDEVYFLLGEVYLRGRENDRAFEQFNRVVKEYPDSQFANDARKRLAELENQAKGKKQN